MREFCIIFILFVCLFISSLGSRKRALYLILSSSPLWIKKDSLKTTLRRVCCEEGKQTRVTETCSSVVWATVWASWRQTDNKDGRNVQCCHMFITDLPGINSENWEGGEFRNEWILWVLKKKNAVFFSVDRQLDFRCRTVCLYWI